jgi:hypothetical protein
MPGRPSPLARPASNPLSQPSHNSWKPSATRATNSIQAGAPPARGVRAAAPGRRGGRAGGGRGRGQHRQTRPDGGARPGGGALLLGSSAHGGGHPAAAAPAWGAGVCPICCMALSLEAVNLLDPCVSKPAWSSIAQYVWLDGRPASPLCCRCMPAVMLPVLHHLSKLALQAGAHLLCLRA